jgi:ureidoacrylate peracid hydrolase
MALLNARPEHLEVDFTHSAIVVVDMQNAFASKGGLLDIAEQDLTAAPAVVRSVRALLDVARPAGLPVVYLQMGYKPDLSNAGGPRSPNCYKELSMRLMRARPQLMGKLVTEGGWDFEIIPELAPHPEDIVIVKTRYSGFAGTTLDSQLRVRGIQYLFFTGIATNVCVESTLRDAYFHDYWPILLTDATMQAGDPSAQDATVFNVESFFGWTMNTGALCDALEAHRMIRSP